MQGKTYNAEFYQREIERDTRLLEETTDPQERKYIERRITSANEHLADLEQPTAC